MTLQKTNRDEFVDFLKGIAILLVVAGHSIAAVDALTPFFNFIYSFHMPLFFFLSGYVEEKGYPKYAQNKHAMLVKRGKAILIPYITWTIIFYFLRNGFHSFHIWPLISRLCGYEQDCLWFLAVLCILKGFHFLFWLLAGRLSWHSFFKKRAFICLCLSLFLIEASIILTAITTRHPILINTITYAIPYFAGASVIRSSQIQKIFENKFLFLGCTIGYVLLFPRFSVYHISPLTQIIKIVLSLCIIVILFHSRKMILKAVPCSLFPLLGRHSLEIYILQTFTIDCFKFIYQLPVPTLLLAVLSICVAMIVSFASIFLSWILGKIPFVSKILFGK